MNLKGCLLFTSTIFLAACGGDSSVSENKKTCRNYATNSITDGGVTQTCNFDQASLILSCSSDSGDFFDIEYASFEDFVLESKTLGLVTATMRTNGTIHINYNYEANQLKSITLDYSSILGDGAYLTVMHNEFDSFYRPTSGTTTSNLGSDCSGMAAAIQYFQSERKVSSSFSPSNSCLYILGQDSIFDPNGNLIETNIAGVTTKYTVQSTEEVCF